jgi:hypothetical protein
MIARRIAATFLPIPLVLVGAWVGGFDFNERGPVAFWLYAASTSYALWQWFAPWWRDYE